MQLSVITPGRKQINPDQVSVISEKGRSIIVLKKNDLHLYYLYKKHDFNNVQITLKIENQGVKDNNIGLVCGKNGENFYEFAITSGGQWALQHHDEKGYKIVKKGGSYAINLQKGENEISIACANKTIIPYINGKRIDYLGTLDDLGEGVVGFNVSSNSDTPVVVAIDNFSIKEPYSLKLLNSDEKLSDSPEFYTEEFDQSVGNWNYDLLIRTLDGESYISIDRGKLITDFPNEEYQLRSDYLPHSYTDVALTLKIANPQDVIGDPKSPKDDSVYFIGALCRITENGWYDFLVSTNGDFWIRIEEPDTLPYYAKGYLEDKILRRGTLRIKTGEINEVTAVCKGDQLSLFVNGTQAITFEDDTFREGKTGFSIGSDQRFPYHVEIESVTISKP
jgi:hypothetical protein